MNLERLSVGVGRACDEVMGCIVRHNKQNA